MGVVSVNKWNFIQDAKINLVERPPGMILVFVANRLPVGYARVVLPVNADVVNLKHLVQSVHSVPCGKEMGCPSKDLPIIPAPTP